jgi:hypothetical protein
MATQVKGLGCYCREKDLPREVTHPREVTQWPRQHLGMSVPASLQLLGRSASIQNDVSAVMRLRKESATHTMVQSS